MKEEESVVQHDMKPYETTQTPSKGNQNQAFLDCTFRRCRITLNINEEFHLKW